MDVRQIQLMLDSVDEEAELVHVWTKPGMIIGGRQRMQTTLFFTHNGVKIEVPIEHTREAKEEPERIIKVKNKPLKEKMGNFFKPGIRS